MAAIYSDQLLLLERANERLYPLHNCHRGWLISGSCALLGSWKDKIFPLIADRYRARRWCGRSFGWNDPGIRIQDRGHLYGGVGISILDFTRLCHRVSKISGELDRSSAQRQPTIVSVDHTYAPFRVDDILPRLDFPSRAKTWVSCNLGASQIVGLRTYWFSTLSLIGGIFARAAVHLEKV